MLERRIDADIFVLLLIFKGMLLIFHLEEWCLKNDVCCNYLVKKKFYQVGHFIMNCCWILANVFFYNCLDNHTVLLLYPLMWWITLIAFPMLNHSCILRINLAWSRCIIFFIHCWTQFLGLLHLCEWMKLNSNFLGQFNFFYIPPIDLSLCLGRGQLYPI